MSAGVVPGVGEVTPPAAWGILETEKDARLVDVRTQAEWNFVGVPDLSELGHSVIFVEWATYPGMSVNPKFGEQLLGAFGDEIPGKLLFLCRSGVRSLAAAQETARVCAENGIRVACYNVAEGFEGDVNEDGHRGFQGGWKFRGLAWRQS